MKTSMRKGSEGRWICGCEAQNLSELNINLRVTGMWLVLKTPGMWKSKSREKVRDLNKINIRKKDPERKTNRVEGN